MAYSLQATLQSTLRQAERAAIAYTPPTMRVTWPLGFLLIAGCGAVAFGGCIACADQHDVSKVLRGPEQPKIAKAEPHALDAASQAAKAADGGAAQNDVVDATMAEAPPEAPATKPGECPESMVRIPPGTFLMGIKPKHRIAPQRRVTLSKAYCIDRTEVTLGAYHRCQAAGICTKSGLGGPQCNEDWPGREKHPVNCVTWFQANAYCGFANKRLPTEAEWEFAARGPKNLRFPWGNALPTLEQSWSRTLKVRRGTTEAGSMPKGQSPFGVLDMGGNLSEWVQDWGTWPPSAKTAVDPHGPEAGFGRIMKDFGWDAGELTLIHAGETGYLPPEQSLNDVGFRCASDLTQ